MLACVLPGETKRFLVRNRCHMTYNTGLRLTPLCGRPLTASLLNECQQQTPSEVGVAAKNRLSRGQEELSGLYH